MDAIVWLGRFIDNMVLGYAAGRIAILCAALGPFAVAVLTIWGVRLNRSIAAGEVASPVNTLAWQSVQKAVIAAVATGAGIIQYMIIAPSEELAGPMVAFFAPANSPLEANADVWTAMSAINTHAGELIKTVAKQASGLDFLVGWFGTSLVSFGTAVLQIISMVVVAVAKVYRFFVLVVSPIFIFALVDKSTASFFYAWRAMLLNLIAVTWVTYYTVGLSMYAAEHMVQQAIAKVGASNLITLTFDYCVVFVVLGLLVLAAPVIAAALTGGSPLSMGQQLLMQAAQTYLWQQASRGKGGTGISANAGSGAPNAMANGSSPAVVPYAAGHAAGAAAGWAYQQIARAARSSRS